MPESGGVDNGGMRSVAGLLLAVSFLCAQAPAPARRAPSFTLPDSNGGFHDLVDSRGKVVLVDIMLTGCPHCKEFTKELEKVKAKYGDQIRIFSIVNPPDTMDGVKQYIKDNKVTSPILLDCGQAAYSYARSAQIQLPRLFIIDQQGMIRGDMSYTEATKANFTAAPIGAQLDKLLARK